ncbi:hypothetical protein HPB52_022580 [Rhipicephalus sanguineus]|uniref:Uncharacterized protein n=1 Tax=Rhipicephalus sanguineus TaxID=34632 RepID=A0A9D4PG10_RHISA|nr:hypothetical protein HPB52_022580 [Rhipicephalus sanguineus]
MTVTNPFVFIVSIGLLVSVGDVRAMQQDYPGTPGHKLRQLPHDGDDLSSALELPAQIRDQDHVL